MRDRAKTRLSKIGFGIMSLGWRGSAVHWKHFQTVYLILAGLSTPLVLSVHSVVSTDFAVANIPGWHTTIFPPFFVAGAIYSGFAMVLNIMIPLRFVYGLESVITQRHLNCMAGVMLATGLMVGYGYIMETFTGWYSGDIFEQYLVINRAIGPYGWTYWLLLLVNIVIPQLLWIRRIRTNPISLFFVALSVNIGMWLERFVIVIVSLHRDFLPSSWGIFAPTGWDWLILFGSVGLFGSLVFLFVRFLPMISISEVKEIIAEREEEAA
jgi:molybdopterin-containing oxidoreductase family membrane subunit